MRNKPVLLGKRTVRMLAALLLVSLLGLIGWHTQSTSHAAPAHVHAVAEPGHGIDAGEGDGSHRHHQSGDHSHDVPLRPAGARVGAPPDRGWLSASAAAMLSIEIAPPVPPPRRRLHA